METKKRDKVDKEGRTMNRVVLIGRLTRNPEIRKTTSGTSVSNFTLAVNRRTTQEGQPDADFISCVAWNKTADLIYQYLHKGSLIGVEGRIQTRSYDDRSGNRVYVTEVVADSVQFLESKKSDETNLPENEQIQDFGSSDTLDIDSEDLPF